MVLFTYTNIILLAILKITQAQAKDCVINNVPEQMAFEKQLKKDLECNYLSYEPPGGNISALTVKVRFQLKRFNLNSNLGVFSTQNRMFVYWKDERLKWDPEKYYGIKEISIVSFKIWTPAFRLFNSINSHDFDRFFYVLCRLRNTGDVFCPLRVIHEAICSIELTHWPYDKQECSLEFGAWTGKSTYFRMKVPSRAMYMIGGDFEAEWFISDYRQESSNSSERQLKMFFVLEREGGELAALVVYPAVILTVLNVTCLFLDVRRLVRLAIACFSLFGHYYFMTELAELMPKQNSSLPNLVLYYRGSVVLTVLIILLTFFLRILCKLKVGAHSYILFINNYVFESYGKYFIFPLWNVDDDTIQDIKRCSQDWTKFANIINSVFSVFIIIAYVSMYFSQVPQPIPINY